MGKKGRQEVTIRIVVEQGPVPGCSGCPHVAGGDADAITAMTASICRIWDFLVFALPDQFPTLEAEADEKTEIGPEEGEELWAHPNGVDKVEVVWEKEGEEELSSWPFPETAPLKHMDAPSIGLILICEGTNDACKYGFSSHHACFTCPFYEDQGRVPSEAVPLVHPLDGEDNANPYVMCKGQEACWLGLSYPDCSCCSYSENPPVMSRETE